MLKKACTTSVISLNDTKLLIDLRDQRPSSLHYTQQHTGASSGASPGVSVPFLISGQCSALLRVSCFIIPLRELRKSTSPLWTGFKYFGICRRFVLAVPMAPVFRPGYKNWGGIPVVHKYGIPLVKEPFCLH